jgi:tetratricopeptide (TPR) repeat protein
MKVLSLLIIGFCSLHLCLPLAACSDGVNATGVLGSAYVKFDNKSYSEALNLSIKAIKIDRTDLEAWYLEARCYYMLSKFKESDEICDKVLRDESFQGRSGIDRFAELAARCTIAYKKQTGRDLVNFGPGSLPDGDGIPVAYEQALLYYDKAIELNPNSTSAWNSKGMLEAELGNYTGSLFSFNRTLQINSTLAGAWNNKGASLSNLGNNREALSCLDKATTLDPNLAEAWYNKVEILDRLKEEALDKGNAIKPELMEKLQFGSFWVDVP